MGPKCICLPAIFTPGAPLPNLSSDSQIYHASHSLTTQLCYNTTETHLQHQYIATMSAAHPHVIDDEGDGRDEAFDVDQDSVDLLDYGAACTSVFTVSTMY